MGNSAAGAGGAGRLSVLFLRGLRGARHASTHARTVCREDMSDSRRGSANSKTLLADIIVDAINEDEQLWAFSQWFEERFADPLHGFMLGEPIVVSDIHYNGNRRRGLTARCQKLNGETYEVGLADVELVDGSAAAQSLAAYRKWLGLDSNRHPGEIRRALRERKLVEGESLVTLVVLALKEKAARCRFGDKPREVIFHSQKYWRLVPGEIVTVQTRRMWLEAARLHLSGNMVQCRIEVAALGLTPLRLDERGVWDPSSENWVPGQKPLPDWVQAIFKAGPRSSYEMERIVSRHEDAIGRSVELMAAGHPEAAERVLMNVTEQDLCCIDAHAHLGTLEFEKRPDKALRHYEVGRSIGELSLAKDFNGLLPWGWTNNRPYLRSLHGYGLSLWRMSKREEAERVFERLLWLNPNDNQGARFVLQDIRRGKRWEERASKGSRRTAKPGRSKLGLGKSVVDDERTRRTAMLAEQMRLADDLDRKWKVEDLLDALLPTQKPRNALAYCWKWDNVEAVSLRELMDLTILPEAEPRPGYLVSSLLDLRNIGVTGFWSVVDRLSALDLGERCNAEWNRRLIKLKGTWRMQGVRMTWSKPCLHPEAQTSKRRGPRKQPRS